MTSFQLGLFDAGEVQTSPASPVMAINPLHTKNAQRVANLAGLGYLPEPVLDPTYGEGGMWDIHRPARLMRTDIDPGRALDVRCDFTALPFRDRAFASCLFDPPYKLGNADNWDTVSTGHDRLRALFGVAGTRWENIWDFIDHGLAECFRVTSRFVIVKCQDQIHSGYEWQTGEIVLTARRHGWQLKDMVHLMNTVSQPDGTSQRHARRNYSTFVVLRA